MVARQAVASDPAKAAIDAMQALKNLAVPWAKWTRTTKSVGVEVNPVRVIKGSF